MLRGYRLFILAFGLILAVASPSLGIDRQEPTDVAAGKVERPLLDTSPSLREVSKGADLEQPCEAGENKRSSDLCAQWKAADAALSAASAAWFFGVLAALISALTLASALAAAYFAKRAADHTETGASAAVAALDSNRPWLGSAPYQLIHLQNGYVNDVAVQDSLAFVLQWKNWGGSPATKASFAHCYKMVPIDGGIDPPFDEPTELSVGGVLIGPGQQTSGGQFGLSQDEVDRFRACQLIIMLTTKVRYASVNPNSPAYETTTQIKFRHGGGVQVGPDGVRMDQITAEIHNAIAS